MTGFRPNNQSIIAFNGHLRRCPNLPLPLKVFSLTERTLSSQTESKPLYFAISESTPSFLAVLSIHRLPIASIVGKQSKNNGLVESVGSVNCECTKTV